MVIPKKFSAIGIAFLLVVSFTVFSIEFAGSIHDNVAAQQMPSNLLGGEELKKQIFSEKLVEELKNTSETQLEVIIQFKDIITKEDIHMLESLDFKILRQYKILPAVYAIGKKDAVTALYDYERTKYVQPNENLNYLMDQSTATINATKAWERKVLDKNRGVVDKIDGSGVTVVVLDSGVDAGHPDLDYGTKVIKNLKSDGLGPWYEMENSDTSSGHGTHCAGTVGGNGDASAGMRRGVAPGVNIIGLSTGELVIISNALGGLEWVYEHSKPNGNIYNIRVVSCSWGGGGAKYDPNDVISQAIEKLLYENNVVCAFAAGNSGGTGSDLQTGGYANTPAAVGIAASSRDGSEITDFSSKGIKDQNDTFPDIAAPGQGIWSASAKRTLISALYKQDDPYYIPLDGTSMATPHVAGLLALLFQAAPDLRVSDRHDDGTANDTKWWANPNTRIHEAEWILKATADYIIPKSGNNVPPNSTKGMDGLQNDYCQGYGLVNAEKAVALALTLHELRKGNPNATVADALKTYKKTMKSEYIKVNTNAVTTEWSGDYTTITSDSGTKDTASDEKKIVMAPPNVNKLEIGITYQAVDKDGRSFATLGIELDTNGDGTAEWTSGLTPNSQGYQYYDIDAKTIGISSNNGGNLTFKVIGKFTGNPYKPGGGGYYDLRSHYTVRAAFVLSSGTNSSNIVNVTDWHAVVAKFEFGAPRIQNGSNTSVTMLQYYYDMSEAVMPAIVVEVKKEQPIQFMDILLPLIILIAVLTALFYYKHKRKKKNRKK